MSARTFRLGLAIFGAALLTGLATAGHAQQGAPPMKPLVDATHLRMQPEQALLGENAAAGNRILILGDPSKPGMYIYRNRFGPGQTSRPHYHDKDRYVTVIKGTWWTDENSDVVRPDKMLPIKAGGFMFHPAGLHHYDGAKSEETIVQIMGMGPVQTIQTEVDADGKPVKSR